MWNPVGLWLLGTGSLEDPGRRGPRGQVFISTSRGTRSTELGRCKGRLWAQWCKPADLWGYYMCGLLSSELDPCAWVCPSPISGSMSHSVFSLLTWALKLLLQRSHKGLLNIGWCLSSIWRLNMLHVNKFLLFLYWTWIARWWAWYKYLWVRNGEHNNWSQKLKDLSTTSCFFVSDYWFMSM